MKKKSFVILIIILMASIFLISACDKAQNTFVRIDYVSKIDGYQNVFTISQIKAVDKVNESVKINKKNLDEFNKHIKNSEFYYGSDKVYNYKNEDFLYQGNECYILTNGDCFFAMGQNSQGYYKLSELKATFYFHDQNLNRYVFKSFCIVPYLNGYIYNALPPYINQGQNPESDILLMIPYEWNYIKLFYSRLEYAQIDDSNKKITINAYAGATDTDFNELTPTWIDEVSFYFLQEDNLNYIKFAPDNFAT